MDKEWRDNTLHSVQDKSEGLSLEKRQTSVWDASEEE